MKCRITVAARWQKLNKRGVITHRRKNIKEQYYQIACPVLSFDQRKKHRQVAKRTLHIPLNDFQISDSIIRVCLTSSGIMDYYLPKQSECFVSTGNI